MATATRTERRIRLLAKLPGKVAGVFQITEGGKVDLYTFAQFAADFGCALELKKLGSNPNEVAASYTVCLAGEESTCECKGFLRHGHCRHIEGLSALAGAGKLLAD